MTFKKKLFILRLIWKQKASNRNAHNRYKIWEKYNSISKIKQMFENPETDFNNVKTIEYDVIKDHFFYYEAVEIAINK